MNDSSNNEQRQKQRIDLKTPATLSTADKQHQVTLLNLSQQGAGLLSSEILNSEELSFLEFSVPDNDHYCALKISGNVTHQTKVQNAYLIGFEFNHPSQHDHLVINRYFNFHQRQLS